jgi:predicted ATPase/DNA-binding winged helix-turn-helix (wHTH) protein/tetratricopeptide (TPR) repeat protein
MQRASASYTFGRFHLDAAERRLSRDGTAIPLTPKAFDMLLTLVRHSGHALTKDELMRAVWPDGFVEEINLASNISILRKALADGQPGTSYIETIPKLGYRFVAAVHKSNQSPALLGEGRGRVRTNLPGQLTRFIGRERELAELADAVRAKRLVTVTGAAGMGKTRLALEVGKAILNQFADGVWLVELAPLIDGALVAHTAVAVFESQEQPHRTAIEGLVTILSDKHALLIIDNCEHVIDASAQLTEALLRACPNLHILATSREALRLSGEVTWRVPPLSMPDSANLPPLERTAEYDAVQLFVEHAALTQPAFTLTPANLASVVQICQQLDGMPLAIEMAAAQVADMGLAGVASGLDDRFALLNTGSRTAVPRHQTLRATLDWSYALLSEPERALLARLSVFAGGWTPDATRVVCESTHQTLLQLARKSLVMTVAHEHERDGQPRYRLLETIRHYADEKLREHGDLEATRDRHLDYFLAMAEEPIDLAGPRVDKWVRRMEANLDNVRAAFAWSMSRESDNESALRLVWAMTSYGYHRGHWTEIGVWANQAWSRADKASANARALGLLARASCFLMTGDKVPGVQLCEQALPLLRETNDRVNLVHCLEMVANNETDARAQAYAEELLPLARELGSDDMLGRAYRALGTAALRAGDTAKAMPLLEQAIEFAPWDGTVSYWYLYHADPKRALALCAQKFSELTPSAAPGNTAPMLEAYGILLASEGNYAGATRMLERCIRASEQMGAGDHLDLALMEQPLPLDSSELSLRGFGVDMSDYSLVFLLLGLAESVLGRFDNALARFDQGYRFANETGMVWLEVMADLLKTATKIATGHLDAAMPKSVTCLRRLHEIDPYLGPVMGIAHIADLLGRRGDLTQASTLLGAVEALIPKLSIPTYYIFCIPLLWLQHAQGTVIAPTLAAARAALGDAEFEAAYAEGQRMTLEQAVEYALSETN